ncbi:hypothetical protein JOC75_002810 [Metabacillus crassostreae]|uniref:hypothetical protein n=1 Tax=Metabacillus crassostreae TaxID=929098 RepID=UPI0019570D65|nr:hypothetical protein [Metabacillus crassostreae]MBM7604806.1 hypothetical protein [Metabacillus crassostreae]
MKKFLISFGAILVLIGAGGIVNHISMTFKAVQEEQEMYGGSLEFMMLQLSGSMGPYLTLIIGGGIIIALSAFLHEYQKHNELNSQLIQVLSEQLSTKEVIEKSAPQSKPDNLKLNSDSTSTSDLDETEQKKDERLYWNG